MNPGALFALLAPAAHTGTRGRSGLALCSCGWFMHAAPVQYQRAAHTAHVIDATAAALRRKGAK